MEASRITRNHEGGSAPARPEIKENKMSKEGISTVGTVADIANQLEWKEEGKASIIQRFWSGCLPMR